MFIHMIMPMAHQENLTCSSVSSSFTTTMATHIQEHTSLTPSSSPMPSISTTHYTSLTPSSSPMPSISTTHYTSLTPSSSPMPSISTTHYTSLTPITSPTPSISSPWDIQTHQPTSSPYMCMTSILKRCGKIMALAISEAGHIYIGSDSKTIRVWKLPGFEEFGRLKSSYGGVSAILVSSEDRLVFTSHSDNKVRIWRSNPIHSRKGTLPSLKDCLIETCINRPMAILMRATTISSKSITSNAAYRHKHVGAITCLAYNSLSKLLYSSSWDKTVKVWSICDMKCIETITAHDDHVNAVVVGPDELLFTGSDDSTVKIWRRSLGGGCSHGLVLKLQLQFSAVKSLVMGGEGEESYILYVGCSDGQVHYWMKGELSGHMSYCGCLRGHSEAVLCLAVIDQIVISGSADTSIRVWRRSSDRLAFHCCMAILTGHTAPVKGVVVRMEDYRCVVYSGALDGSAKQWLVWKEGCVGGDGAGRSGFVGNDGGSSWADYCEISRLSG